MLAINKCSIAAACSQTAGTLLRICDPDPDVPQLEHPGSDVLYFQQPDQFYRLLKLQSGNVRRLMLVSFSRQHVTGNPTSAHICPHTLPQWVACHAPPCSQEPNLHAKI